MLVRLVEMHTPSHLARSTHASASKHRRAIEGIPEANGLDAAEAARGERVQAPAEDYSAN